MAELQVVVFQQPGQITSNFEEIKNIAIQKTKALEGVIVTEDTVKDTKKDIAEFRGYQKEINTRRIEAKKEFLKPFESFESQCNEAVDILERAIEPMNKQVKEFDIAQKEEKKQKAYDYYLKKIGEQSNLIVFEEIFKDSWLNTSTSFKSIKVDIDTAISNRIADIETITGMNSEVQEKALSMYFKTKRLSDAVKVITDYEKQKAEILAREEAKRKEEEERRRREEERRIREDERRKQEELRRQEELRQREAKEREEAAERERRAQEERVQAEIQTLKELEVESEEEEVPFPGFEEREVLFPGSEEKEEEEVPFPGEFTLDSEDAQTSISDTTTNIPVFKKYLVKATSNQHELIVQTLNGLGVQWSE